MYKSSIRSKIRHINANAREDEIAALVNFIRAHPSYSAQLVKLLPEQHPIYEKRSANSVAKIRGYILAAFEQTGLPVAALPYVLEELQNGRHAYAVAAAAKALRGLPEKSPELSNYLLEAFENIKGHDDAISFEAYRQQWPVENYTTGLLEIIKAFEWLGAHAKTALPVLQEYLEDAFNDLNKVTKQQLAIAVSKIESAAGVDENDCCSFSVEHALALHGRNDRPRGQNLKQVILEDQDGETISFSDFFSQKPTLLVFFYTRCDNPNKCSLTISKLGRLQAGLLTTHAGLELNTAAISYDAAFDTPSRMKAYGTKRGVFFSTGNRMFRVVSGFDALKKHFDLGVNYTSSIVNRHRTELFILDKKGRISYSYPRMQWDVPVVIKAVEELQSRKQGLFHDLLPKARVMISSIAGMFIPLLIAFFPKCPFCWAAYLSMFGFAGLQSMPYAPWLLPVFIALAAVNLFALYKRGRRRKYLSPFLLSFLGFILILIALKYNIRIASWLGLTCIIGGSLLNMVPDKVRLPGLLLKLKIFLLCLLIMPL